MLKKRKKLKVKKLRGGGGYQGGRADTPAGASPAGSVSRGGGQTHSPHSDTGYVKSSTPTKTQIQKAREFQQQQQKGTVQPPKGPPPKDNFINTITSPGGIPPVTPVGITIAGLKAIENARRKKRAKGEFFFSSKKTLPATRDFYKVEKRPLQTQIGGPDEGYLKDAGIIGGDAPPPPKGGDGPSSKPVLCPDGSMPPCVDTTKQKEVAIPRRKVEPYPIRINFSKGGLSGGVKSGPPPKRGPNPQGMKKGGMACPHRPDGIRGQGAAIKGFKFTGVK